MVRKKAKDSFRKGRITQAWTALNLYNLSQFRTPYFLTKSFFQQKWMSKSISRHYHGKHVREKQWQLMFNRKIPSVVEMDPRALARDDGSRHSAGRGSGQVDQRRNASRPLRTPFMDMTFWPLERRLDTAIYRAMFASSVRMARQFVIHGHVKVNGQKLRYPGYLLNPGDMFSVDPELVMLGTGLRAGAAANRLIRKNPPPDAPADWPPKARKEEPDKDKLEVSRPAFTTEGSPDPTPGNQEETKASSSRKPDGNSLAGEVHQKSDNTESDKGSQKGVSKEVLKSTEIKNESHGEEFDAKQEDTQAPPAREGMSAEKLKSRLRELDEQIKKNSVSPIGKRYVFRTRRRNRLFKLRELRRSIKEAIKTTEAGDTQQIETLTNRAKRLRVTDTDPLKAHMLKVNPPSPLAADSPDAKTKRAVEQITHMELLKTWPNVELQDKPYATPWVPRHWMSAFAFIPRYLEVNQNVCSAVYLRHPVARPGLSEVPSPFATETNLLSFQWYLRRR